MGCVDPWVDDADGEMTIEKRERQERIQKLASDLSDGGTESLDMSGDLEEELPPITCQPTGTGCENGESAEPVDISASADGSNARVRRHMFRRVSGIDRTLLSSSSVLSYIDPIEIYR